MSDPLQKTLITTAGTSFTNWAGNFPVTQGDKKCTFIQKKNGQTKWRNSGCFTDIDQAIICGKMIERVNINEQLWQANEKLVSPEDVQNEIHQLGLGPNWETFQIDF